MPIKTESFSVAVILSAYHNRLLVPFPELRGLLDFMTGHKVALWEIPAARKLAADHLRKQYPWLAHLTPPPGFKNDVVNTNRFVKSVTKHVGEDVLEVRPMPKQAFKPHGPFEGEAYQ